MEGKLASQFIIELFKTCLVNKQFLVICKTHLQYEYLENEYQKDIYKYIISTYNTSGNPPTIGIMSQAFSRNPEIITLLSDIQQTVITDQEENLLDQLEKYIKNVRFIQAFEESVKLFNSENHKDRAFAITKMAQASTAISTFSLKGGSYETVFADFDSRQLDRAQNAETFIEDEKCLTGIAAIDEDNRGGVSKGSTAIIIANSGKFKSTWLRWIAIANARRGQKVVYFQVEETNKKFFNKFDAGWTGIEVETLESGAFVNEKKLKEIKTSQKDVLRKGGEIILHSSNSFNSITMDDCRAHLLEIVKNKFHDGIDVIIFDYAELFSVKDAYKSDNERGRREDITNKMTNLAKEFNAAVFTATQASNIPFADEQNPDFLITRNHISEFKGMLRPFSYAWSINQTIDEASNKVVRIWMDKARDYLPSGILYKIAIAPQVSRFYDAVRTKELNLGRMEAPQVQPAKKNKYRGKQSEEIEE